MLTDSTYREEFLDELTGEMRQTFEARAEYEKAARPAETRSSPLPGRGRARRRQRRRDEPRRSLGLRRRSEQRRRGYLRPRAPARPAADATPPDTQITEGPKSKTTKTKASFEFSSTEAGSTFECKLDDGGFEPCTSPEDVKAKKGKHTFEVRAKDAAGNVDPTPATQSWKVKKKKKKK